MEYPFISICEQHDYRRHKISVLLARNQSSTLFADRNAPYTAAPNNFLLSFFVRLSISINSEVLFVRSLCMDYKALFILKISRISRSVFCDFSYFLTWISSAKIKSSITGTTSISMFLSHLNLSLVAALKNCSKAGRVSSIPWKVSLQKVHRMYLLMFLGLCFYSPICFFKVTYLSPL